MVGGAAAMLAACGSGGAASGQPQAVQGDTAKLDVAGLRPGTPAAEAKAGLERQGWRVDTEPGQDWTAAVEAESRRQRGGSTTDLPRRGVGALDAVKGDERMRVEMRPTPAGSIVSSIRYEAPMGGRDPEQVRAQMTRRYGTPTYSQAGPSVEMGWCTGGERCRSFNGARNASLGVTDDVYGRLRIVFLEGSVAEYGWQGRLKAAVGGAAPARSSF